MLEENPQPPKTTAEIGVHIFYIGKKLEAIEGKLDGSVSREEFDEFKLMMAAEIAAINKKLEQKPWIQIVLGMAFSALLTSMLIYVVTDFITGSK